VDLISICYQLNPEVHGAYRCGQEASAELDLEIATEEARTGISDPTHFAYPTYAKTAMQRRDNLRRSVESLERQLEEARSEREAALADLRKIETINECEIPLDTPSDEIDGRHASDTELTPEPISIVPQPLTNHLET
jgi:hypothetical protein